MYKSTNYLYRDIPHECGCSLPETSFKMEKRKGKKKEKDEKEERTMYKSST